MRSVTGKSFPAGLNESDLQQAVQGLRDEVRVLQNVIDEFRETVESTVQNGMPINPDFSIGIIKQMARDPLDPEWAMKLVVLRSTYMPSDKTPKKPHDSSRAKEAAEARPKDSLF